ncbi:MAG: PBP1A family penicillin-binding protein [Spirochaetes bacterium]|nr:MAG: PBP1A family penicillin-binding protein [Spirochaetota bacterium]
MAMLKAALNWVRAHKKIVFIYAPMAILVSFSVYTGIVYLEWEHDKEGSLKKLARYKKLIDHTEELRQGSSYSYSDVDLSAKVVDIPTRIYDRNGKTIGEFFEQKREIVPYASIPSWLVKAVIASEDRDFQEHRGVSFKGIFRAFLVNIVSLRVVQGGSTITQQLAKVLFTDMERSLKRKIYEAFCAWEIEKRYDKTDILSMYLNLIYFGNGAYGVEAASRMFFGTSVRELNETECAMIVGTISNPLIYSPLTNLPNSLSKTKRIMQSMVDAGFTRKDAADYQFRKFTGKWDVKFDAGGKPVSSLIGSFLMSSYRVNRAPLFNEQIRKMLVDKFGEDVVKKGGLSVYTTIDGARQDVAEKELKAGVLGQREYHLAQAEQKRGTRAYEEERENASNIEGALIALNPQTGEIVSYVGGYSFSTQNQMDHVAQVYRQPGSSFKPLIYAAALEARDITPSSAIIDEEKVFRKGYAPKNYDNKYLGKVTARDALAKSINIAAVKVLDTTGYSKVIRYIRAGLDLSSSEMGHRFQETLSMALGAYELSPLENCTLHAVLVNGGNFIKPYGLRHVKDYNGNIVWNFEEEVADEVREKRKKFRKIIDPVACAVTVSMLKGVFEEGGTAYYAIKGRNIPFPVAGKTGTTSNYSDAWFIGYTANIVTAVWVGNRKGAISLGQGRAGGVISANIWSNYIGQCYQKGSYPGDFQLPEDGYTRQTICLDSGMVPREKGICPRVAVDEIFYSGTEPGEYCPIHVKKAEGQGKAAVK